MEAEKYRSSQWLYDNMMIWEKKHTLNGHFLMIHLGTDDARTDKFYLKLDKIITALQKKGYNFVSLEDMIGLNLK